MDWKNKLHIIFVSLLSWLALSWAGCSISYSPNGGALDYTQLKTITIGEVINKAPVVYPTLAPTFTEKIKDYYESRTRLSLVPQAGDLELNCTITGYDLTPMSIGQDNFAERTAFTVTMQVKYTNRVNEKESFDRSFKAHRDFPRSQPFVQVQDDLLREIMDDLLKQVYNATVENW